MGAFSYCADTSAVTTIVSPDAITAGPVHASGGSTNLGFAGLADASAGPGALRAVASASVTGPPPPDGFSFTSGGMISDARVFDSGFIVDTNHTLPTGTPVTLHVTMTVEGLFTGIAEADTDLFVGGRFPALPLVNHRGNFVYSLQPSNTIAFDVTGAEIGDPIYFYYQLTAQAFASNDPRDPSMSLADAGDTALINFDFLEGGVTFESASGHDYATAAATPEPPGMPGNSVPEPASTALVAIGAMAWAAGRRRGRC